MKSSLAFCGWDLSFQPTHSGILWLITVGRAWFWCFRTRFLLKFSLKSCWWDLIFQLTHSRILSLITVDTDWFWWFRNRFLIKSSLESCGCDLSFLSTRSGVLWLIAVDPALFWQFLMVLMGFQFPTNPFWGFMALITEDPSWFIFLEQVPDKIQLPWGDAPCLAPAEDFPQRGMGAAGEFLGLLAALEIRV